MDTKIISLSENCRFHLGEEADAWQSWFDDSDWQQVTLPHDWSVTLPFDRSCSSGTGYLPGGIGWYRIRFSTQKDWAGKHIRIFFDGIYKNSRVWCNSHYLGERPCGYSSFSYDLTDILHMDSENIIVVRADHREIADSRWYTGSGITRSVFLRIEEPVHPLPNGIFFFTKKVSALSAECEILTEIQNASSVSCHVTVTSRLSAPDGATVLEMSSTAECLSQSSVAVCNTGTLPEPLLWSPEAPFLYTLETFLSYRTDKGNVTTLSDSQKVGIRSLRFDPDLGFFLNGSSYTLKGVCLHEDAGCFGNAVPVGVWHRRLSKLKKMGCNAIRMSHNPHMPELYSLCDALGFLVIDEAFDEWEAPKNKWSIGHNVYPPKHEGYYVYFPEWHERDLTDLIRRDRNHPCIMLFSIGNEIDYPNDPYCHPSFETMTGNNDSGKPSEERKYNPARPNAERLPVLAKMLCDIVHRTDPTHPVTLAAAFPELSASLGFLDPLDVVGYNYKEHLYEAHHKAFPHKPFLGSENGHSLAAWKAVTDKAYISGQFLWTGIDYLGEAHGWPIHGSGAGLLTMAGFEKPAYFRRQSFWSAQPMIFLSTILRSESGIPSGEAFPQDPLSFEFAPVLPCWDYPYGEEVVIKCYSNLPEVEFFLNGESLGIHKKSPDADCILLTLPFTPGILKATGCGEYDSICHTLHSGKNACTIHPAAYDPIKNTPALNRTHVSKLLCHSKVVQLTVTLRDADGRRCIHASTLLHVQAAGARLVLLENGDLADVTDYGSASRRAYHGQLMLYLLPDQADFPITVRITGELLKPCTCEVLYHADGSADVRLIP